MASEAHIAGIEIGIQFEHVIDGIHITSPGKVYQMRQQRRHRVHSLVSLLCHYAQ